jgi:hypothetical protein
MDRRESAEETLHRFGGEDDAAEKVYSDRLGFSLVKEGPLFTSYL